MKKKTKLGSSATRSATTNACSYGIEVLDFRYDRQSSGALMQQNRAMWLKSEEQVS